jgi:hypothetical protein
MSPLVAGTEAAKSWHDAEGRVALGCNRLCELRRCCLASSRMPRSDDAGPVILIRRVAHSLRTASENRCRFPRIDKAAS